MDKMKMQGRFQVEHRDKDGNLIGVYNFKNGIVTDGFNKMLNILFDGTAAIATWYIGLIDNSGFVALASTDLMSSHPGWAEFTGYSNGTRQAYTPAAASNQQITSNANTQFSINTSGNVKGMFITSDNTKGGTAGTLWCTGLFDSVKPVNNLDTFKVIYTLAVA